MMRAKNFVVMGALSLLLGTAFAGGAVKEGGSADAVTFKRNSNGVNLNQIITQASPPSRGGGITAMFEALAGKTVTGYCTSTELVQLGGTYYSTPSTRELWYTIVGAADGLTAKSSVTARTTFGGADGRGSFTNSFIKTLTPVDNTHFEVSIANGAVRCMGQELTQEQVESGMTTVPMFYGGY